MPASWPDVVLGRGRYDPGMPLVVDRRLVAPAFHACPGFRESCFRINIVCGDCPERISTSIRWEFRDAKCNKLVTSRETRA
jgi:hypothetical protein